MLAHRPYPAADEQRPVGAFALALDRYVMTGPLPFLRARLRPVDLGMSPVQSLPSANQLNQMGLLSLRLFLRALFSNS
jgi:hypothetical protein